MDALDKIYNIIEKLGKVGHNLSNSQINVKKSYVKLFQLKKYIGKSKWSWLKNK